MLTALYQANSGKPIVGVQMQRWQRGAASAAGPGSARASAGVHLPDADPVMNVFGAHFEKGTTEENIRRLCLLLAADAATAGIPTLLTGDFNAVLARE
jgi:hypothetical protein